MVIKVWAGDSEEGEQLVSTALMESMESKYNTSGWDGIDEITLITKRILQKDFKVTTYRELESMKKREQKTNMKKLIADLRNDILPLLAPSFMTKTDAILHVTTSNKGVKDYIEKLFKAKKDIKRLKTFDEITDAFLKVLVTIAKERKWFPLWRMNQIKKLDQCLWDPEPYNTLQCSENHYAELPCDDKKGLHPYYFQCFRHI